jgi:carboxypeptidase C (cathepsin A)
MMAGRAASPYIGTGLISHHGAVVNRKLLRYLGLAALALALAIAPAAAQRGHDAPPAEHAAGPGVLSLLPADSVTEHILDIGGDKLAYTATAGTLSLFDQSGDRSAAIFYTAYTLKNAAPNRPVTFVFNGGPGAASAYLHLGVVGPQVIQFAPGPDGAAPRLRDNPDTWLKFTDLVIIDPVGTGWSRTTKADDAGKFWSAGADAQSLAKTIALYVTKNGRTASPKYLLGESYGGYRAIKVARTLQQDQGTIVNGIVMLSPYLEGQLGNGRTALGAALQFPSLAAADLDRRGAFSADALAAAERFALTDYLTTLAGKPPEGDAARALYARVAEMTGLPVETVARAQGFVGQAYEKRVREGHSEVFSPYDASVAAADPFPESESSEGSDPVLDGFTRALGGAFAAYARDQLGFKTEMTYTLLNRETAGKWDWGDGGRRNASVTRDLRELLGLNPGFRLMIAHGRDDLVTPYAVSRYILDHTPQIGAPNRTQLKLYRGGHMFYFNADMRTAFAADAAAFYRSEGL